MFTKSRLCVVLSVVALLALSAAFAQATSISVANYSFEDPVIATDGDYRSPVSGWSTAISSPGLTYNPLSTEFTGAGGNGTPSGADGTNVFFASGGSHYCFQDTPATIAAGVTYTLTVALGESLKGGTAFGEIVLAYGEVASPWNAGTVLAQKQLHAADITPLGQFNDFTVSYTAPSRRRCARGKPCRSWWGEKPASVSTTCG